MKQPKPLVSRLHYRSTETITFRVTPEDKDWLYRVVQRLNKRGQYSQGDVLRTALRRLQAGHKKGRLKWLEEQIKAVKEEGLEGRIAGASGFGLKIVASESTVDGPG